MISRPPIEWNHPATWPWMICVWIALVLGSFIKPAWKRVHKRRVASWPVTDGRITAAEVSRPESPSGWKQPVNLALFEYTYTVAGEEYSDTYERECATEEEAEEFIRDLENRPVNVHVHPRVPSRSGLVESDVQAMLLNRPPAPAGTERSFSLPFDYRFLLFFEALSAVGLLLSLWIHIGALLGKHVAPDSFFRGLHVGIFVVWLPAIFVAIRLFGNLQRKDIWKTLLKGTPDWMRYLVYGLFAYTFVNVFLFTLHQPAGNGRLNPPTDDWREFSGSWMFFYSTALAIFDSARHQLQSTPRCPKGHSASLNDRYCPECGLPIDRRA